ncbi:DnaJ domain-containing protein [Apiospora phragmitis]|uniref:DnaJ domain-containing protein n=1 Tax=Apiospora phragmitis TaxID=2905665 RepID=A0ABR1VCV4_9PEZI
MSDSEDHAEDLSQDELPTVNAYEVLVLERSATGDQIKSAYRKLALKHHPDKVTDSSKQEATQKFQEIAFAYAVLSDPARRKRYDETGSTSEAIVDADGFSWSEFYSAQFRDAISDDAIAKFAAVYKGSDEEKDDVLAAYEAGEGDMDQIYESVMLSNVLEDDARFRAIINEAIKSKDVPAFKAYTKETKKSKEARVKAAKGEANEAEEYAKELGIHDKLFGSGKGSGSGSGSTAKKGKKGKKDASEDALAALIRKNQQSREERQDNFFAGLEAKWAGGSKKGKKRTHDEEMEEPPEEAFEAMGARKKGKTGDSSSGSTGRPKRTKK